MKNLLLTTLLLLTALTAIAQENEFDQAVLNDDTQNIIKFGETLLQKGKGTKEIYKRLAIASKDLNRPKESLSYLLKACEQDTSDTRNRLLLAEQYYSLGMEEQSLRTLTGILAFDSTNTKALSLQMGIYRINNDIQRAAYIASKLCRIDSTNASNFFTLGKLYENLSDSKKSVALYTKAIELDSTNVTYYIRLSSALIMNNRSEDALQVASKGLSLCDSLYTKAAILLQHNTANAYYRMDQNDSCIAITTRLIAKGDSTGDYSYRLRGFASYKKGFYLDASQDLQWVYDRSYNLDSLTFDIPYFLGKAYYEIDRNALAQRYLSKAMENIQPNYTKLSQVGLDYALALKKGRQYYPAIDNLKKAIEYTPEDENLYIALANIYSQNLANSAKGISILKQYLASLDQIRKGGKNLTKEQQNSYSRILQELDRRNTTIFFEKGADGKGRMVIEKRDDNGKLIEKKTVNMDDLKKKQKK